MQRILVTGAGGFVGTHLVRALKEVPDYEVFAAVYHATSDLTTLLPSDHVLEGDLTDYDFAERLVKTSHPNTIFHLAALSVVHSSAQETTKIINSNTTLQYNILEAVKNHAPQARVIAISSANGYGLVENYHKPIDENCPLRPLNPYAVSKVAQEMLALQYALASGLDIVILRPFNHTGAGQTTDFVVPRLAQQFTLIAAGKHEPVIALGNLETTRDFTDVRDMVQAYILAAKYGKSGEIYNIGSGKGVKISQLVTLFEKLVGLKITIKVEEKFVRRADVPILICNANKFVKITSWKPKYQLEDTLSSIYNYWKEKI